MNPSKNAQQTPSELGAMVSEWHICASDSQAKLSPNLLPGKGALQLPCSHPAHPLHIQCHILTASPGHSCFTEGFHLPTAHPMLQESQNENNVLDFAICIISKMKLARGRREAAYIKVLSSLPRTLIILWTRNRDSVQVWSLNHEHQYRLGTARNAVSGPSSDLLNQNSGTSVQKSPLWPNSRWPWYLLTLENHCPRQ